MTRLTPLAVVQSVASAVMANRLALYGPRAGGRAASRAVFRTTTGAVFSLPKIRFFLPSRVEPHPGRPSRGSRGRSPWYVPPGVIHRLRLRENEPILVGAETEPVGNCSGEGGTGGEPGRHLPGALISDVDRKRPDLVDLDQDVACCIAPVCKVAKGFRSGEPQSKEAWP